MPRALWIPVTICVLLLACVGVAFAAIPDTDGYTYLCVNKASGQVRARDKGENCKANEQATRVVANQAAIPNITTYIVSGDHNAASGDRGNAAWEACNSGDKVVGGGVTTDDSNEFTTVIQSGPYVNGVFTDGKERWLGGYTHVPGQSGGHYTVYAICQHTA